MNGARAPSPPPTAAALVIGNELLSGKVQEANVAPLARTLRSAGVLLRRVVTVLDDVAEISREVRALSTSHDWLFTSGGVGPTHDDVTIEAVAGAFGVSVESHPALEAMIRRTYGERCTPGHLRMALVPRGAVLETTEAIDWPAVRLENTWILPGIPEVFRMKLPIVARRLLGAAPFVSYAVFTHMDEGDLKPLLDGIVHEHPEVDVGSYPRWLGAAYRTKVTFDGRDAPGVLAARDAFIARLPPGEAHSLTEPADARAERAR